MRFIIFGMLSASFLFGSIETKKPAIKCEGSFIQWDKKLLDLLAFFVPSNPTIIQANSFYGGETLSLAQYWPNGKIISFEPSPDFYKIQSSKTTGCSNIQIYHRALNDFSGNADLYFYGRSSRKAKKFERGHSLLKPSSNWEICNQGPVVNIECVVLDEWCHQNRMDRIDLLCLNLGGMEFQVLKSSPKTLKNTRCIYVHTYPDSFQDGIAKFDDLKKFLDKLGFQLLTHWYNPKQEGDAIFVNKSYFFDHAAKEFIDSFKIDETCKRYYEPRSNTYFDLCDSDDSIKKTPQQGHAYEGNIGAIIEDLIKPGSCVLDIGSHIGIHTVCMSNKTGPNGAVVAFEPDFKFYAELLHTLKINHCKNVLPICKALSETSGQGLLSTSLHSCPQIIRYEDSYSIAYQSDKHPDGQLVDMVSLDSLNLKNLSLIKMDVENYEYFILKGAEETIKRNRPVIVFECWIGKDYENSAPKEKANFDRVISLLESYGYDIHVIYCNDFIAFPSEATGHLSEYKKKFKKLDLTNFDIGL